MYVPNWFWIKVPGPAFYSFSEYFLVRTPVRFNILDFRIPVIHMWIEICKNVKANFKSVSDSIILWDIMT